MKLRKNVIVIIIALILVSASIPLPVLAAPGDETVPGTISLVPTIECIGVTATYSGDNNQNNSVLLQYRVSGGSWKTAPEMYHDVAASEYRGSIFFLTTATSYEVKATFQDADGAGSLTATTTTRNDSPAIGTSYLYVATNGSDTTGDGTQSKPWRTIQKAANNVDPGETVLVRAGTYSESVVMERSGTASNYITFMPYQSEQVILNGNGTRSNLITIEDTNYIRIKGFTFTNTVYSSTGAGVYLMGADNCIVEDNLFLNVGGVAAILMRYGCENSLIQRNEILVNIELTNRITGIYWWKVGGGQVIRDNTITGTTVWIWDGFGGGPENEEGYLCNSDFYNNTMVFADYKTGVPDDGWDRDDGMQPEGSDINIRIWNNWIENGNIGIALCPTITGPAYVFRNVIFDSFWEQYKLGDNSHGRIYMYHNTYYTSRGGDGYKQTNSGLGNIVSRNNIVYAGRYVFEFGGVTNATMDFDYDSIYTTSSDRFVKWGSTYRTLSAFQSAQNQELNAVSVSDNRFVDEDSGDLHLDADSPCIDAGVVIPGFNDENSPWPYSGNAPDIGAYESGYSGGSGNTPPVAVADSYATSEDTPLTVSAPGVLSNDTDADGNPLTANKVANPSHGSVTLNSNGSFTYTPSANYFGSDSFTYRARDGISYSNTVTVSISVAAVNNDPPVLAPIGNKTVTEGQNLQFTLSASDPDGGTLTYSATNLPLGAGFNQSSRVFTWTPTAEQIGTHSPRFQVKDSTNLTDFENVSITVRDASSNPPPDGGGGGDSGGGGGGGGGGSGSGVTSLLDSMNGDGKIMSEVLAASADMKVRLTIPRDTIVRGAAGGDVNYLSIKKSTEPFGPCEGSQALGLYYEITPAGTTFEPEATLVFEYETAGLPANVSEDMLYIALWDPAARTWTDLEGDVNPGTNTVTISIEHLSTYALMAHNRPASCQVDDLSLAAAEVAPGESIVASAVVCNTGDFSGAFELELKLDDEVVETRNISLDGGASKTVSFVLSSAVVGAHVVSVGGATQTFLVRAPQSPEFFTANDLAISPVSVSYGGKVIISASVVNGGPFTSGYLVELVIDGAVYATREITLDGGASRVVAFDIALEDIGTHTVNICGLEGLFEVRAPMAPDINGEPRLELTGCSIDPTYNEATRKLVFTRVVYRMNEDFENFPGAGMVLAVYYDGELLERVPMLTLGQMHADGLTGEFSYIPGSGWESGEYTFRAELYDGEVLVQETELQKMTVNPESITMITGWWTLGAVIGVASILILVLIGVIIYRKRDMLRE